MPVSVRYCLPVIEPFPRLAAPAPTAAQYPLSSYFPCKLPPSCSDEHCQPMRGIICVGTPASQPYCRDKGLGRVDVGALCLSSSGEENSASYHVTRQNLTATRTSTRPPPFPASAPCPYWTRATFFPL